MTRNNKTYLSLLMEKLVEHYHLTPSDAEKAVMNSAVRKMLHSKENADWQMHQPLMFTVEQIYCEYMGLEVPVC